jgi:general secretion pathway protein F
MAVFEYKALNSSGKAVNGMVDADSAKFARSKLRRQGIFPTEVWEQRAGGATRGKGLNREIDLRRLFQGVSSQDLALATGQLATLVNAGITVVEALHALEEQVDNPILKSTLVATREDVNQGDSLADALEKHPKVFNGLFISMIRAGEKSGALGVVLLRLTEYTESQVRLKGKVMSALMYPVLMGFVSFAIVMGLFIGVIPRIRRIFESFGEGLPLITRVMLWLSEFLQNWWFLLIVFMVAAVLGAIRWVKLPAGRAIWHQWKLKFPIFGKINRQVAVSRFCRTMATLLDSGVPILSAVAIVQTVVQNDVLAKAIEEAGTNIREGQSIAAPLKASGEFDPMVTHMIAIGEKTGELEPMLSKVADAYDQQVENTLNALTSLLEPLLILVMGGVVTIIALSILLPMLNLSAIAR